MSAWRLPRGSTAAEREGGALRDAHAQRPAVRAGVEALAGRRAGGRVGAAWGGLCRVPRPGFGAAPHSLSHSTRSRRRLSKDAARAARCRPSHPPVASMDNSARAASAAQSVPANAPKMQPKPQALPSRSSLLVSPRQKGNPILNNVRAVAWEYSDIPADYVVGATTCALFLSLKYHRLHPEYIYNRIRDLKGQYNLRILLTMVDIESHEEPLKELSKTSLVNNVTVMLCWSAQEAGRYLELFKTFENAAPTSIRAQQSTTYSEKMVEFITVPRSINKTDAVGLVSNFGSIRTAINAGPEEIGLIAGWGDKKVQRWSNAVGEPFRIKKAARRAVSREDTQATLLRDMSTAEGESSISALDLEAARAAPAQDTISNADQRPDHRLAEDTYSKDLLDEEEAMREADSATASLPRSNHTVPQSPKKQQDELSDGVMAALSRLRNQ
ncbi:hypothetical protein BDU57DRAFT_565102 [Ampelomyces quisqualis]|uniref:ERCC1-like central domain-containing protein n=1 Tax=Ampelomyces quisqualis TaxID=50730 RepID=A0A6A5QBV0_AMPQU|nr:hypothetical protein BDU57DRAFT_565102 [Ampelomyces quisqualis]